MAPIMKLGVTTYIWAADFTPSRLDVLPRIKAWGFDGIELPIFRPEGFPAAELRRGIEQQGLDCTASIALVSGLSLVSDDADVRRRTLRHVEDTIKATAELGARLLAGPVYAPVGYLPGRRRTADEWQRAVEAYQRLEETLAAHDVTLAIEPLNRFETYFLNTAADGVALCEAASSPHVGLLFDTFHANIEAKDVAAALRLAAPYVRHIHMSENDRGTPGSGHVDWPGVMEAIRDIGYDRWLTIEGFGFALGDLSAAASIWRDIEPTPETIPEMGIKFLKRLLGA